MRLKSVSASEKRTQMGFTWVSVVSRLESVFALTRLPSERCARPVTPEIGAETLVYERFSSASFSLASAEAIAAVEVFSVASAWSRSRCEIALSAASGCQALHVDPGQLARDARLLQGGAGVLRRELERARDRSGT